MIINLSNLSRLAVYECNIRTQIPTLIGSLAALTSLTLEKAVFRGGPPERLAIPTEIARLTNLQSLSFSQLFIEGAIPRELMNLTLLTTLKLSGRALGQLDGRIPSEIGQLTRLRYLDVSYNEFGDMSGKGVIPVEISNLSLLEELHMANSFASPTPPQSERLQTVLGNLTGLRRLNMRKYIVMRLCLYLVCAHRLNDLLLFVFWFRGQWVEGQHSFFLCRFSQP